MARPLPPWPEMRRLGRPAEPDPSRRRSGSTEPAVLVRSARAVPAPLARRVPRMLAAFVRTGRTGPAAPARITPAVFATLAGSGRTGPAALVPVLIALHGLGRIAPLLLGWTVRLSVPGRRVVGL